MTELTPFDDGELYDRLLGDLDFGRDYYLTLAKEAVGPVLDIACGTGRILLPCLQAGVDIEGIDLYPAMLDQLRRKAAAMNVCPRLHQADMSDFVVPRQFALIMIPFNAFIHNVTADAQIRCLTLCREHLLPRGRLVFDTFFPSRDLTHIAPRTRVLEGEITDPTTGQLIRCYDTRTFDLIQQTQRSEMEIEFINVDQQIIKTACFDFTTHFFYKTEMELLLRLAGFRSWQIYGDFSCRPLENETDLIIVSAENI